MKINKKIQPNKNHFISKFNFGLFILLLLPFVQYIKHIDLTSFQIFAVNDTTNTWTFDSSTAGNYTYDSELISVDNSGASPTGGNTGANELTNPAFTSNNSSWSIAAIPIDGWAEVPGNATYSTTNFLAMQYEAKYDCTDDGTADIATDCSATPDYGLGMDYRDIASFDSANVLSSANGAPIVHITHTQAVSACPTGYHLINNDEWMTIVRNAELQTTNWADATLGSLVSASGGIKRGNIGSSDSGSYNGTDPEYGTGRDTKAKYVLSNGSEIWDISGNLWNHVNFDANNNGTYNEADDLLSQQDQPEATDGTTTRTTLGWSGFTSADPASSWYIDTNGIFSYDDYRSLDNTLTALNGMGRIYHFSDSSNTTKERVLLRGGSWNIKADAGPLSLRLYNTVGSQYIDIGFRCASDPIAISQTYTTDSGREAAGGNTIAVGSITDAKIYQSANVGDTGTYDFSAYVYDKTSGNDGGTISSGIAELYYNGAVISTTYTDSGSGWWKLSGTLTGANENRDFGLMVKKGKTIVADDFTLSKQGIYSIFTTSAYLNSDVITWDSILESSVSASGNSSVVYQLCTDNGSTCESGSSWQYWNGSSWTTASNSTTHTNTIAQLTQSVMQSLSISSQKISVKAILSFAGSDIPTISSLQIGLTTDSTGPVISNIASTTSETGATITWDTDEISSTQIEYGLTSSYGSSSTEIDTSTRVTSHSDSLSSLVACSKYYYRVKSTDSYSNQTISSGNYFNTTGCVGSATIDSQTESDITAASGGEVSLLSSGTGLTLVVASGATNADANYQIKKIDSDSVINSISTPSTYLLVADYTYDLKALTNTSTYVSSLNNAQTITINYNDSDLAGKDESTLIIYRWDGSSWNPLQNCVINTSSNTISCETTNFSTFALFSQAISTSSDSTSTTSSTESVDLNCNEQKPSGKKPSLYAAINQDSSSVLLYFSSADGPKDHYILEYGVESGKYIYSENNIGNTDSRTNLVKYLKPNTTYFFRIRAANGCAAGEWSNEISIKTKSLVTRNNLKLTPTSLTQKPVVNNDKSEKEEDNNSETDTINTEKTYKINIEVLDKNNQPLKGVQVTLHSTPRQAITDEDGIATFEDVEQGNHRVIIDHENYNGEQAINLEGNTEEYNLNIVIEKQKIIYHPVVIVLFSLLLIITTLLILSLIKIGKKK